MHGFAGWFFYVFPPQSISLTVMLVAVTAVSGLLLGSVKIKGFSLGIPGCMFTGLIIARLVGKADLHETPLNVPVIGFIRTFGLMLFVYAVGIQVGPGFLASLRKRGWTLNLMTTAIVLLGAAITVGITGATKTDIRAAVGLFAGGTTNAPSLESAAEALKSVHGEVIGAAEAAKLTTPALAISYPFGLLGVILAMVVLKVIFRVNPQAEGEALEARERSAKAEVETINIELKNPNLNGVTISDIPMFERSSVVISRIMQQGKVVVATPETKVHSGDVLLAVGPEEELRDLRLIVGEQSKIDLRKHPASNITTRAVNVTHRDVLGKSVDELDLARRVGVTITRVYRAGVEFTAVGHMRLQFGDRVRIVGEPGALDRASKELGDSMRELNHPRLLPIFIGLTLGAIVGCLPIPVPGLPVPVKLGLAAGPMIVAIILARIGRIGPVLWYMPHSASQLMREFGITLFLIGVALLAGDGFFNTLQTPTGLYWLGLGAVITFVPLMVVGLAAVVFIKTSYLHTCGLLCGSMTSPSLAFTQTMTPSEEPAVAFATVYPLTMVLRVLTAQLMVLIFASAAPTAAATATQPSITAVSTSAPATLPVAVPETLTGINGR